MGTIYSVFLAAAEWSVLLGVTAKQWAWSDKVTEKTRFVTLMVFKGSCKDYPSNQGETCGQTNTLWAVSKHLYSHCQPFKTLKGQQVWNKSRAKCCMYWCVLYNTQPIGRLAELRDLHPSSIIPLFNPVHLSFHGLSWGLLLWLNILTYILKTCVSSVLCFQQAWKKEIKASFRYWTEWARVLRWEKFQFLCS